MTPSHWFQLRWSQSWAEMDITTKELLPIVLAVAVWGRLLNHLHICFHSDNLAVVAIIRKRSARNHIAHHLLRCFYFYAAFYHFQYSIKHVPSVLNTATDTLSCNNLTLFSSLIPQASQTVVDTSLEELLITQRPDWDSSQYIWLFKGIIPGQCFSSINLAKIQLCSQEVPHLLLSILVCLLSLCIKKQ